MARKLKLEDKKFHNSELTIPIDGKIAVGPRGEAEVSEAAAKVLLTIPGWIDPEAAPAVEEAAKGSKKGTKTKTEPENTEKPVEVDKTILAEELDKEALAAVLSEVDLDSLKDLPIEALGEIATKAQIKNWEKFKANKSALATYIKNQLKLKVQ